MHHPSAHFDMLYSMYESHVVMSSSSFPGSSRWCRLAQVAAALSVGW